MKSKAILAAGLVLALSGSAKAQQSQIVPLGNGNYLVTHPGHAPQELIPYGMNGGYMLTNPGGAPSTINPAPFGGWTIHEPEPPPDPPDYGDESEDNGDE